MSKLRALLLFSFVQLSNLSAEFSELNIPLTSSSEKRIEFICPRSVTTGSLTYEFLKNLKELFQIPLFVESGTYLGGTAAEASKIFEKVYSVELSDYYYNIAKNRLGTTPNIELILGNSEEIFCKLLPQLSDPVFIYLDGHNSGGITAKGKSNTPILNELIAIRDTGKQDSVLLIDDIRLFQDTLYPERIQGTCKDEYPSLEQVINILFEINPTYQMCFLGDALLVYPKNLSIGTSPLVRACSLQRISRTVSGIFENELFESALIIANANGKEQSELIKYYSIFANSEIEDGFGSYAALWYSLLLINHGQVDRGIQLIKKNAVNCPSTFNTMRLLGSYGKLLLPPS